LANTTYTVTGIDALNSETLAKSLMAGRSALEKCAETQPTHDEFLQKYCPADEAIFN
jgi:tryptophan halogenase